MTTKTTYVEPAYVVTEFGVTRFARAKGESERRMTGKRRFATPLTPTPPALVAAARRHDISIDELLALRHMSRATKRADHAIAKRALQLLENGETLTDEWRREVDRVVATWHEWIWR